MTFHEKTTELLLKSGFVYDENKEAPLFFFQKYHPSHIVLLREIPKKEILPGKPLFFGGNGFGRKLLLIIDSDITDVSDSPEGVVDFIFSEINNHG